MLDRFIQQAVMQVLQADFGFRPRNADRPYDPATRRVLLSTEHVLDARSNSALLAVRVLLGLGQRMIAVRAVRAMMNRGEGVRKNV